MARHLCHRRRTPATNPNTILWTGLRPDGPQYIALWEQNSLAYAIDRASKLGFAGGLAHRDAIAKFQLKLFTSDPDYPRAQAAPSVVAVGTPDGQQPHVFPDHGGDLERHRWEHAPVRRLLRARKRASA